LKELDRFTQNKLQDEEESQDSGGLDLSSHLDVFHAVWKLVRVLMKVNCIIIDELVVPV
jgi:hypothetical protein